MTSAAILDLHEAPPNAAESAVFGQNSKNSWIASAVVHAGLCTALATLVIYGHKEHQQIVQTSTVEFEAAKRAEPPPPPPPPPMPPPARPVVRPAQRVATPQPAQAPAPVAAPPPVITAASTNGPSDNAMASGDNANFQGGLAGAPLAAPEPVAEPVLAPVVRGPVQLPENATAPEPLENNVPPEYPAEARASGTSATIIARIVVDTDGSVGRVDILRGHPLFDDVVKNALRAWRYRPAQYDGTALAVYQIVRIPFRLENM